MANLRCRLKDRFDDESTLAFARADPSGCVATLPPGAILDEIQRVPELLRTLTLARTAPPCSGLDVLVVMEHVVGVVAPLHLAQAGGVDSKGGGDGTRVADFVRAQVVAIASAGKVRRQGCIPVMGDGHSPKRAIIVSMASSLNVARKFAFQ